MAHSRNPRQQHETDGQVSTKAGAVQFVARRNNWGEDRVCYRDGDGEVKSLPAAWTDIVEPDPFVVVAAGRSPFRVEDLLVLVGMTARLRSQPP